VSLFVRREEVRSMKRVEAREEAKKGAVQTKWCCGRYRQVP
jgi:hypothetical protein